MAGKQDFWEFFDDFIYGGATFGTSASATTPWGVTDTSAAGTPTYVAGVDHGTSGGPPGVAKVDHDNTNEVQNVCLSFLDVLQFDINDRLIFESRVKMNQASVNAATSFAFGLTGDRNATIDTIAQLMLFRVIGGDSTTAVVCESDDGTTDKDDIATGQTLVNAYKRFVIDAQNLSDVKFFMSDANGNLKRVASGTTFDMSAYSGALQPFFQLQKTAATSTDGFSVDYVRVTGRRLT